MYDPNKVPEDVIENLKSYVKDRQPPSGFLYEVLANDLKGACHRADSKNGPVLVHIVGYIYNNLPTTCWGSTAKVEAWLNEALVNGPGQSSTVEVKHSTENK
jgi:hypothetical protein